MSEFAEILGHKNRAKAAIRKLSIEQCDWLIEIANEHKEELKQQELEEAKLQHEREKALQKAQEALAAVGLDFEVKAMPAYKKPRKKSSLTHIPDKYQIMDIHGYVRNWSGFGHPPVQFKQAFAEGIGKEEMLRDKHAQLNVPFTDTKGCEKLQPEEQKGMFDDVVRSDKKKKATA